MAQNKQTSTVISTVLALALGLFTLSVSAALLYSAGIATTGAEGMSAAGESAAGQSAGLQLIASQRLIFSTCGLGFATLSGYIVGLVARRAPMAHAAAFSLMLVAIWAAFRFWDVLALDQPGQLLVSTWNIAIAFTGVLTGGWIRYAQTQAAIDFVKEAAQSNE